MSDLFADIKVGDSVAVKTHDGAWVGLNVTKVTRTQFETGGVSKWRKADGRQVGRTGWAHDYVVPWAPERRAEAEQYRIEKRAERACKNAAERLSRARGEEAIRLAALLPDELKETRDDR